jgi:hypothetical protein
VTLSGGDVVHTSFGGIADPSFESGSKWTGLDRDSSPCWYGVASAAVQVALAQPDLQPMDGAVIFEWEGERPRGDLRAIELRRRDASLQTLRVLDHDLVP